MKMNNLNEEKLLEFLKSSSEVDKPDKIEVMGTESGEIDGMKWAYLWGGALDTVEGLRNTGIIDDIELSAYCIKIKLTNYDGNSVVLDSLVGLNLDTNDFELVFQTGGKARRIMGLGYKVSFETLKNGLLKEKS